VSLILLAGSGACARRDEPTEITGVVVEVDSRSLADVRSFEVSSGGDVYLVFIDPAARYSFPPSHLRAHLASAEPVRVGLERRDGRLYATSIEDA
jgi:hypothetical protein